MMSNDIQRLEPITLVVAKDNLKQAETKGYSLQNKKSKIMSTYLKRLIHTTGG